MANKKEKKGLEGIDLEALKALLKEEIRAELKEEDEKKKEEEKEALRAEIKAELEQEAKEIEEKSKKQVRVRKDVDLNRYVEVRSICTGTLTVKTKLDTYSFYELGAVQEITIGELKALKNSSPAYFTKPLFIIEDEEATEICGMTDFYKKILFIDNLPKFFAKSTEEQVTKKLNEIPQFLRMEIIVRLKERWTSGEDRDSDVCMYFRRQMGIDISEGD